MKVLGVDTAGPRIGVAVRCDATVVLRQDRVERGAESRLLVWVSEVCAEAGVALADLDGLAVSHGPGAFTGLRVGLATANGLAMALGKPVVGVDSLRTRAGRVADHGLPVLALLDARKGRVYAQWFAADGNAVGEPADVDPAAALASASPGFLATGEGAVVYATLVEAAGGRLAESADDPALSVLCAIGARELAAGRGLDPTAVVPRYVRAPDAVLPKGVARGD